MSKEVAILVFNDINFDQRVQKVAISLMQTGYVVTIFSRRKTVVSPIQHITIKTLPFYFAKGPLAYLEFNVRLIFNLWRHRVDIIYANDPDTLVAALFKKWTSKNIKLIYDSHEYFVETPEVKDRRWVKSIWHMVQRLGTKNASLNLTVNHALAEKLSVIYQKPFYAIYNATRLEPDAVNGLPNKQNILIYQGVLNEGRGLECSIDAMAYLPTYTLWIFGDGDIAEALKHRASKIAQDRILFWGKVSPPLLSEKTKEAKFGLNLLDGTSENYRYSMANKFFDYMHAGIPSINMDFVEYQSIIAQYKVGITINALDAKSLAMAITQLDEQGNYENMVEQCNKAKLDYNWQKEAQKLIALLDKL